LNWLRQRDATRPFFVYLHYMDVHAPYFAAEKHVSPLLAAVQKAPGDGRVAGDAFGLPPLSRAYLNRPSHARLKEYVAYWRACYDAGVPQVDEHLGVLRDEMRKLGVWDDAWIVLVSDHGESLGEREALTGDGWLRQIWGHGDSTYQTELHVPWAFRWLGRMPAGKRVPDTVGLVDLVPTMLDYLQIDIPEDVQGRSVRVAIGGEPLEPVAMLAEGVKKRPDYQAIVRGPWKLIAYRTQDRWELYNLDEDPHELKDVAAAQTQRVAELRGVLEKYAEENRVLAEGVRSREVPITDEEKAQLQALGYLQDADEAPEGVASQPAEKEQ
jgi:arylsulfatase A-like enzyme